MNNNFDLYDLTPITKTMNSVTCVLTERQTGMGCFFGNTVSREEIGLNSDVFKNMFLKTKPELLKFCQMTDKFLKKQYHKEWYQFINSIMNLIYYKSDYELFCFLVENSNSRDNVSSMVDAASYFVLLLEIIKNDYRTTNYVICLCNQYAKDNSISSFTFPSNTHLEDVGDRFISIRDGIEGRHAVLYMMKQHFSIKILEKFKNGLYDKKLTPKFRFFKWPPKLLKVIKITISAFVGATVWYMIQISYVSYHNHQSLSDATIHTFRHQVTQNTGQKVD